MNCFLVKDILHDKQHVYYGEKIITQYANHLIQKCEKDGEIIIEMKDADYIRIYKKKVNRGYLYNTISTVNLFIITVIEIVKDDVNNNVKKFIIHKNKNDDEFLKELKETLSKRIKNKLD